jgi:hypothetical protein
LRWRRCCCQHCCCRRRWRGLPHAGQRGDCHDPCVMHSSFVSSGVMRRRERRMKIFIINDGTLGDSVARRRLTQRSERAPHQKRGDRKCGKRMTVTVVQHTGTRARQGASERASKHASRHACTNSFFAPMIATDERELEHDADTSGEHRKTKSKNTRAAGLPIPCAQHAFSDDVDSTVIQRRGPTGRGLIIM